MSAFASIRSNVMNDVAFLWNDSVMKIFLIDVVTINNNGQRFKHMYNNSLI